MVAFHLLDRLAVLESELYVAFISFKYISDFMLLFLSITFKYRKKFFKLYSLITLTKDMTIKYQKTNGPVTLIGYLSLS